MERRESALAKWVYGSGRKISDCAAEVGVSRGTFQKYLTLRLVPSLRRAERISRMTGGDVTVNDLVRDYAE